MLKALDHPNCMKLVDTFEDKFTVHIVTELCTGGELFEEMKGKQMEEARTAETMHKLFKALAHCHAADVIHRDIKP